MGGLDLLARAELAGLKVEAHGARLVIKGPKRADSIARELLQHKAVVLTALAATPATPPSLRYGTDVGLPTTDAYPQGQEHGVAGL
jgi:hypothetical protein